MFGKKRTPVAPPPVVQRALAKNAAPTVQRPAAIPTPLPTQSRSSLSRALGTPTNVMAQRDAMQAAKDTEKARMSADAMNAVKNAEKARMSADADVMQQMRQQATARGLPFKKGGSVKGYATGGMIGSASKRADGIAQRGKTRGKFI